MKKNKTTHPSHELKLRLNALDQVERFEVAGNMTIEKRLELAEMYFDYLNTGDLPQAE